MHISGLLPDIGGSKPDIGKLLVNLHEGISNKGALHIIKIYEELGKADFFGRSGVERIVGLKTSRASEIINIMLKSGIKWKKNIIYHGSNIKVVNPRILADGFYKAFGYGFYCTRLEKQAKR